MVLYDKESGRIGLDADEERFAAFGFAGGSSLLETDARETFQEARYARNEAKGDKPERDRARDGDILWVDANTPGVTNAVHSAMGRYVTGNLNVFYLDTNPSHDPNSLGYQAALAAREKVNKAMGELAALPSFQAAPEPMPEQQ